MAGEADRGPLGEQHYEEIREAVFQHRGLRQMIGRSRNSALITMILAAGSTLLALFWPDLPGVVVSGGLWIIGIVDFWAYRELLLHCRARAATVLGVNQLALLGLIIAYCVYQMLAFSYGGSSESMAQMDQMMSPMGADGLRNQVEQWTAIGTYGFYGLIILLSVLFQGLRAVYYLRNRRKIEALNKQTPGWIRRLMNEMRG